MICQTPYNKLTKKSERNFAEYKFISTFVTSYQISLAITNKFDYD